MSKMKFTRINRRRLARRFVQLNRDRCWRQSRRRRCIACRQWYSVLLRNYSQNIVYTNKKIRTYDSLMNKDGSKYISSLMLLSVLLGAERVVATFTGMPSNIIRPATLKWVCVFEFFHPCDWIVPWRNGFASLQFFPFG